MSASPPQGRLGGKVALVTGAGSGIGKEVALAFARAGATTVCADIQAGPAAATAHELTDAGGSGFALELDVSDADAAEDAAVGTLGRAGPVDVLFHAAGLLLHGTATTTSLDAWRRIVDVNLTGTWLMAKAVLPGMVERRSGSIVTIASVAALVGVPSNAAYAAAKGGVVALTRQMAVDFAPFGVRANTLCPGTLATPALLDLYARREASGGIPVNEGLALTARRHPLGRVGSPSDIVGAALFLASDESAWVTGAVIPVDGGLTAAAWTAEGS